MLRGIGAPSGVRTCSKRSGAFTSLGLKLRMPSRAKVAFRRLMIVVRSPTNGVAVEKFRHSETDVGFAISQQPLDHQSVLGLSEVVVGRDELDAG